jgi:hypothetical protein
MSLRRWLWLVVALALCVGLVVVWRSRPAPAGRDPEAAAPAAPPAPAPAEPQAAPPSAGPGAAEDAPAAVLGLAAVDLEAVRAALPENLYWQSFAPTNDPALLEEREREKAFRNEQYGKILSGTGSDAEILDYYDHRMRASTDYIQFVDHLLEHYGSDLTDQDLTLLHVAKRLHQARLEEIPRRIQEARERKAQQDEARRAWLEQEREFRGDAGDGDAAP